MNIPPVMTACAAAILSLLVCGCDGGSNPASPSPTPDTRAPSSTQQTYNVSGIVRQSVPSDVLPGVRVDVIDGPNAGQFTTSDADGRYVLSGLIAGTLRLRASRNGYAPAEQAIALSWHTTVDFTIVRGSACALSGSVRESPGDALSAGAIVELVKEPGGRSAPAIVSSTTGATGTYELGGIDCGVSRILRVEKPDFSSHEESVLIAGNTRRDVTISRVTYSLQGFVRESPSGTPLVYATIEVVSGPYAGRKGTTHTDGSYSLSGRDTLAVRASKPGYVSQEATVTVAGPATYRDFSLSRQASAP